MEWYNHAYEVPSWKYDGITGEPIVYIVYAGNILSGQEESDSHKDFIGHKGQFLEHDGKRN